MATTTIEGRRGRRADGGVEAGADVDARGETATLFLELAPLRNAMFLLALWPIQSNPQGRARASLVSPAAGYAALVFAVWSVLNAHVVAARLRGLAGLAAGDLDGRVTHLVLLALLSQHWAVPLCIWAEAAPLASYFNAWTAFQAEWREATGRPLVLGLRSRALASTAAGIAFPVLLVILLIQAGVSPAQAVAFFPPFCFFLLVGGVWATLCAAVEEAAGRLRRLYAEDRDRGLELGVGAVRAYGSLWLRLRALATRTGEAQSRTLVVYTVYSMALGLMAAMGVMTGLAHADLGPGNAMQAVFVVGNLQHIYSVHDAGHRAAHAACKALQYEMLYVKSQSEVVKAEVRTLLMATAIQRDQEPSVITLGGFAACSRSGIIEVYNMLLLNLLVLLQFAYFVY